MRYGKNPDIPHPAPVLSIPKIIRYLITCLVTHFVLLPLDFQMLYPLQSVRGNYSRLRSALAELEICMNNTRGAAGSQSTLGQGVREAASAFKRQSNNMMQVGYAT